MHLLFIAAFFSLVLGQATDVFGAPIEHKYSTTLYALGPEYILSWTPTDSYIDISFSGPVFGWLGLGFSNGTVPNHPMLGSRAVVGWDSVISSSVTEYALNGFNGSDIVPSNSLSITNTSVSNHNGITTISFRTLWNDNTQYYIDKSAYSSVIAAIGQNKYKMSVHTKKVSWVTLINFSNGKTSLKLTLAHAHGILMALAWIFFLPAGILFARYGKSSSKVSWIKLHLGFQLIGSITALVGFILIVVYEGGLYLGKGPSNAHQTIGFVIVLSLIIQVLAGLFRPANPDEGQAKPMKRVIFEVLHKWNGRIMWFLASVNIFLGLSKIQAPDSFSNAYGGLLGALILGVIFFEIQLKKVKSKRGGYLNIVS